MAIVPLGAMKCGLECRLLADFHTLGGLIDGTIVAILPRHIKDDLFGAERWDCAGRAKRDLLAQADAFSNADLAGGLEDEVGLLANRPFAEGIESARKDDRRLLTDGEGVVTAWVDGQRLFLRHD